MAKLDAKRSARILSCHPLTPFFWDCLQSLAYEYAKLGARLALVARREEKLESVANHCRLVSDRCRLENFVD
jgi:hypothetical protein